MKFDERLDGDFRIYAGALDVMQGDGYIAAVVISRVQSARGAAREVFRDEGLACGHRWMSADEALMFALCKAREWIVIERRRNEEFSEPQRSPRVDSLSAQPG